MSRPNENPFFNPLEEELTPSHAQNYTSTQNTFPSSTQPNPNQQRATSESNNTVRDLMEICPSIDREVIEVILSNNDGNFDQALNELLALSDPSFAPPTSNVATREPNSQVLSDEEYAKALQAAESGPTNDQTKADEDYARAILAAEQGYLEDVQRLQELSLADSSRRRNEASQASMEQDNGNSGITGLMEKSKKKFLGLFNKNSRDGDQLSISDQPLSPQNRNSNYSQLDVTPSRDSNYDIHQEVTLSRRENLSASASPFEQLPSASPKVSPTPKKSVDLLGDDPPEDMVPIAPVSQLSSGMAYSSSVGRSQSPPPVPIVLNNSQSPMPTSTSSSRNPFFSEDQPISGGGATFSNYAPFNSQTQPSKNPFE